MDPDEQISIFSAANMCMSNFDDLLCRLDQDSATRRLVEELRGRFNLWAAYVGAFAMPKASLDARLSLYPDLKCMVLELLDMVSRNTEIDVQLGQLRETDNDRPETDAGQPALTVLRGLDATEAAIERLVILGVQIRRGARRVNKGDTSTEQSAAGPLCSSLIRHRYPYARQSLCNQLGTSIHARGISIQYIQKHNQKLAYKRPSHSNSVTEEEEVYSRRNGLVGSKGPTNTGTAANRAQLHPVPETFPSAISPSAALRLRNPKPRPFGTLVSKGHTVHNPGDDHLHYPSVPRRQKMEKYIPCTICSEPLEVSELTENTWKSHVDRDLELYVCISEECRDPLRFFVKKEDWIDHMKSRHTVTWAQKVHTEMWHCDVSHCATVEFGDMSELLEHLQTKHGDLLTKSKIQGRARRNRRIAGRDPFVCPLCDSVPEEVRDLVQDQPYELLWEHIARHLRSLALLSLSYIEIDPPTGACQSNSVELYNYSASSRPTNDLECSGYFDEPHYRTVPSLIDIEETHIMSDGTRTVGQHVLSGPPSLLSDSEDWAFIPQRNDPTDIDGLSIGIRGQGRGFMIGVRQHFDPASVFRGRAPWIDVMQELSQEEEQQTKVLGAEHPDTLTTRSSRAYAYWNQGRFQDAESLQLREMSESIKALGSDHPFTLISANNLASIRWSQGKWKEAAEQFRLIIKHRVAVLGPEDPATLASMNNLASTYRSLGKWSEANELDQSVECIRKRVLGPEDPSTLATMSNVAFGLWNSGEFAKAEQIERSIIGVQTELLGSTHPDTLISLNNLACTYQRQRRWEDAEELAMQVVQTSKQVLGEKHPFTLTCLGNLALTYRNQDRLKQAGQLELQVFQCQQRLLGPEHPDTLLTRWNLAHTLKKQRRYEDALSMLDRCVQSQSRQLGDDHPHTIAAAAQLKKWRASFRTVAGNLSNRDKKRKNREDDRYFIFI
ncbi:hypothetical protein BDV26DRAFT_257809 [Aspergillus bertholletiae]|uniref:Tetratricopeptide repeat-domain-containing protein n=1 Tax=Aspergillus bertholletiae TaxID=1226010 RepID=A0A5N7BFD7_9EURO|nr:hypothetical protein BDV26DRAFT_257809 [Aspergillus bertholletiae]